MLLNKLRDIQEITMRTVKQLEEERANDNLKKRKRRFKDQIERNFTCPVDDCFKAYGNESSLLKHIKGKHNQVLSHYEYNDEVKKLIKKQL